MTNPEAVERFCASIKSVPVSADGRHANKRRSGCDEGKKAVVIGLSGWERNRRPDRNAQPDHARPANPRHVWQKHASIRHLDICCVFLFPHSISYYYGEAEHSLPWTSSLLKPSLCKGCAKTCAFVPLAWQNMGSATTSLNHVQGKAPWYGGLARRLQFRDWRLLSVRRRSLLPAEDAGA